jgi:pyruvate/2-oxoglutarate dehydrogenase complex dihydrolipoamide acyltransferase (E2) component
LKITPFTRNRQLIADQLERARRFHCSITLVYEFDVTPLLELLEEARRAGRDVGFTALLVKATGTLLARHPRLNRHVFHRWFRRYEVAFDHVSCTLVVARVGPAQEELLFPVLIRHTDRLSVEEIHRIIRHHKREALGRLPQTAAFQRIKEMSRPGLWWFGYKARSDPRFYERYFGTYGLSSNVGWGWGPVAGSAVANTGVAFLPGAVRDLPRVVEGEIRVRKVLSLAVVADHNLVDGADIARAAVDLRWMLESGVLLEPAGPPPGAGAPEVSAATVWVTDPSTPFCTRSAGCRGS